MADIDGGDAERDLTKHDRLVNAWLAVGDDAAVTTVASLVGASKSYASQVRQAMDDGDLTEDEIDEVTDPDLVERYRQADQSASAEGRDSDADEESIAETNGGEPAGTSTQQQWTSQPLHRSQHAPPREPTGERLPPQPQQTPPQRQQPPQSPRQSDGQRGQTPQQSQPQQRQRLSTSIQAEDGLYVPVSELQAVDATLATLEEEAQFEVQNVPAGQPQHQSALAKLFVTQKARAMIGEVTDEAVSADEAVPDDER